jgi:hypothetical protein
MTEAPFQDEDALSENGEIPTSLMNDQFLSGIFLVIDDFSMYR